MVSRAKRASQVNLDDRIPFVDRHVGQHAVAQNAGIVDEHVEAAKGRDRLIDHPFGAVPIGHVIAIGDRLAPHGPDFFHNRFGGFARPAFACPLSAEIVHHDPGALTREFQAMLPPDTSGAARHDNDAPLAQSRRHSFSLPVIFSFRLASICREPSAARSCPSSAAAGHPRNRRIGGVYRPPAAHPRNQVCPWPALRPARNLH